MARPRKVGLDYFSHDTDTSTDDKIEAFEVQHGPAGYALYFKCLERIYRNGGPIDIKGVFRPIMAAKLRVTPEALDKMIQDGIQIDLFCLEEDGKLMSEGAKKRLDFITKDREKARDRVSGNSSPENPQIRGESKGKETKGNKRKGSDPALPLPVDSDPGIVQRIIDHLNATAGKRYRLGDSTRKIIAARLNEGFTEADLRTVIEKKSAGWKDDDKMEKYLRPETLFQASKFDGYLNEPWPKAKGTSNANGYQRPPPGSDRPSEDLLFTGGHQ